MALNYQSTLTTKFPSVMKKNIRPSRSVVAASTIYTNVEEVKNLKIPYKPIKIVEKKQVNNSMSPEKIELFNHLGNWAEDNILVLLNTVEKSWQPQDFVPDPSSEEFMDRLKEMREVAQEIPDDYFVVLVGDMITEEALPTYQTVVNSLQGVKDETGVTNNPWAIWLRAWTAEESRHGDLLNKYLYLSGRVDMKAIEKTTQYLLGSGMDCKFENNPYLGYVYTSFQERATFVSHGNTARLAKKYGDIQLAKICGTIASDEKRHEIGYTRIVEKLFEMDPDTTMLAFANMMKKNISMPAELMYDGQDDKLFDHYAAAAQRIGVYTTKDYTDILEFFIDKWKVEKINGLSPVGRKAQEFVCELPKRFRRLEERAHKKAKDASRTVPFSWVFGQNVKV
ncbi:hypothetical protein ACFE04_029070 [Oxalis oulophora]